jgi:hypothetical protein
VALSSVQNWEGSMPSHRYIFPSTPKRGTNTTIPFCFTAMTRPSSWNIFPLKNCIV